MQGKQAERALYDALRELGPSLGQVAKPIAELIKVG
jgi:hypothetical protein